MAMGLERILRPLVLLDMGPIVEPELELGLGPVVELGMQLGLGTVVELGTSMGLGRSWLLWPSMGRWRLQTAPDRPRLFEPTQSHILRLGLAQSFVGLSPRILHIGGRFSSWQQRFRLWLELTSGFKQPTRLIGSL